MGSLSSSIAKTVKVEPSIDSIDQPITRKVLLLGTPNSGKTTILKQLLIHWNKWNKYDILNNITYDIIDWLLYFIDICNKNTNDLILMEQDIELLKELKNKDTCWNKHKKVGNIVKHILNNKCIQELFKQKSKHYYCTDDLEYILNNCDILFDISYFNDQNISMETLLKWYIKTFRPQKQLLQIRPYDCEFWDHGGMPCQMKRWVNSFDNVSAIIWVVSLDDYSKECIHDPDMNALILSIQTFNELVNSRWFAYSIFFILFTKKDLFSKQLKLGYNFDVSFHNEYKWNPKHNYYPSYIFHKIMDEYISEMNIHIPNSIRKIIIKYHPNGNFNDCYNRSLKYIKDTYLQQKKTSDKYPIVECFDCDAFNSTEIARISIDLQNSIIENSLHKGGLI